MHDTSSRSTSSSGDEAQNPAEELGHPRGTLAIVLIYAIVFALSWLALYVFQFLGRGAPQA